MIEYEAATLGWHTLRHRGTILKALKQAERDLLSAAAEVPEHSSVHQRRVREAKRYRYVHDRIVKLTSSG